MLRTASAWVAPGSLTHRRSCGQADSESPLPAAPFQRARAGALVLVRGAALRLPSVVGATARAALAGAQLPRRVLCHTRPSQAVAAAASSSRVVATLGGEGVAPLVSQAHGWARCHTTRLPSEFPYRHSALRHPKDWKGIVSYDPLSGLCDDDCVHERREVRRGALCCTPSILIFQI